MHLLCETKLTPSIRFRHFLYHYAYPPPSRWSYGLLGSLGRRHAQTPCDFGLTRPRNVRCHQGHWSWSWPVWPLLEGYRVENPILQETELGRIFRPRPLGALAFSFSQCTRSYYELLHQGNAIVNTPSGLVVKIPPNRMLGSNIAPHSIYILYH